ncbi:MAG: ClpXP protease specificity-enhancing factor [Gammaproteobacteria bacterium]|nr:ClpXP protease specificity-enhancing factor [Gammaproteobacteria bacterium]
MTSSRPYLIRAIHEWIVDNEYTPYVLVNAIEDGVVVPQQHVENDKIILNLSPKAIQCLHLGNDLIEFEARFSGTAMIVSVPPVAVMAIYARENGQGMIFEKEEPDSSPSSEPGKSKRSKPKPRPNLRVVK